MSPSELNKCLQKFYLSARKRDGSFYNKKSLTAIRAALDRHLRSPPFSKPFSIIGDSQFNDANISLSNFLKTLSKSGQIAPTMHKQPLTKKNRCQTLRRRWACWHWLTPTTQTAANSLVFYQSVPWKTRSWKPAAFKEAHARLERNTKWWKIFGNEQRAWSSVGDQKPSRWPWRQRRRVERQNIRKTWLKTLPGETHREIPLTSESGVQQFIPETTKPVQIV